MFLYFYWVIQKNTYLPKWPSTLILDHLAKRYSTMKKRIIYFILLLFLLANLGYSFVQHLSQPLDGDMSWNIVPGNNVRQILADPFGIGVIIRNQSYPNPNRFFCHWTIKEYFTITPLVLQKFVQPIDSIYLSCALVKISIQVMLILLLATAISGTTNFLKLDFLIGAVLVAPLFQTNGYQDYMGIIDTSPSYTFFYALPCAFLLLYFLPFILKYYHKKEPAAQLLINVLWIPFALVISLSGPLNPGIVLIFSLLLFYNTITNNYFQSDQQGFFKRIANSILRIPKSYWFYLLPITIFSLYSLYIGRYNSYNINKPLIELYSRLPNGIYHQFVRKLGFPVLFIAIVLNIIIINATNKTVEGKKILGIFKWISLFSLLYILLLPLGGYRDYRPNILRYDTIMPITLSLMFMFGISTLFLFNNLKSKQKIWYIPIIVGVLFIFMNDNDALFDKNKCERTALKEIAESKDKIVLLPNDCTVLSWGKIIRPEDSELNARLLTIWRVTKNDRLYYNK
jgi:hypothetical protein